MSLLIKGMDMPKDCGWCPCMEQEPIYDANGLVDVRYYCQAIENLPFKSDKAKITDVDQRLENCPLSEVPTPHGRVIDADRLIAVLKSAIPYEQRTSTVLCMIKNIENAPTVIEKEV